MAESKFDYDIIIDSCTDLPRAVCEEHDLKMVHFKYADTSDSPYALNGVDDVFEAISAHDFYESMRKGASPSTSQPSQAEYTEVFNAQIDSGRPAVYMAFTSGLSGAYEAACMALDHICEQRGVKDGAELGLYIVDTLHASSPEGLFAIEVANQREQGLSITELVEWAEEAKHYIHTIFMVEDLDTLHRGGRVPKSVAVVGTKLDVKPLLTIDPEGKLSVIDMARGRRKGMRKMVEFYKKYHTEDTYSQLIANGNADCPEDAETLRGMVREVNPDAEFLITSIGPTIGCHVGPGMVSLCFWGDDIR